MIEVYTHTDSAMVGFYRTLLEDAGIETFFRNENVSSVEVLIPVFYPTLCVIHPEDEQRARDLIRATEAPQTEADAADWQCPQCAETVPGGFAQCWNCSAQLPDTETTE